MFTRVLPLTNVALPFRVISDRIVITSSYAICFEGNNHDRCVAAVGVSLIMPGDRIKVEAIVITAMGTVNHHGRGYPWLCNTHQVHKRYEGTNTIDIRTRGFSLNSTPSAVCFARPFVNWLHRSSTITTVISPMTRCCGVNIRSPLLLFERTIFI